MNKFRVPRIDKYSWGVTVLKSINAATSDAADLKAFLENFSFPGRSDDLNSWLSCILALQAASLNNFGVGAVLADENDDIIAWGHNQVFTPKFQSSHHAEMVVVDMFEKLAERQSKLKSLVLFTSLEPCPMCLTRLITSRIGTVVHVAEDPIGGMVKNIKELPPIWQELASNQTFRPADCHPGLRKAGLDIFLFNERALDDKLMAKD